MSFCRVRAAQEPLDPALVSRFAGLATTVISDAMGRVGGAPGLLPVTGTLPSGSVAGAGMTVRTAAGDNLVVHKALDLVRPGEVLVVDAGGHEDRAIVGELMCRYAAERGAAAIVIDGAVRDGATLPECGVPVFARALCHLGPYKNGPGEIRGTVSLAGLAVADGDVIIGDGDGVCVVPRADVPRIIEAAEGIAAKEQVAIDEIGRGRWDRSWVDEQLDIEWLT